MEYSKEQIKRNIVVEDREDTVFIRMYLRYSGDVKISLTIQETCELFEKLSHSKVFDPIVKFKSPDEGNS